MDGYVIAIIAIEAAIALVAIGSMVSKYCSMKREELQLQRSMIQHTLEEKHNSDELAAMQTRIDYSKSVMEYIRLIVTEQAVIEFRAFLDSHILKKVTRSQVAHVVEDVAKLVQQNVQTENINFDDTIMSEDFFMHYIINLSVNSVKKLLDDAVQVYDEEGDDQDGRE